MRPRVMPAGSSVPRLLEEEVQSLIDRREIRPVRIVGGLGCGKSTALGHLAAVLGDQGELELLDEPGPDEVEAARQRRRLVIYTSAHQQSAQGIAYTLARWTEDDWIEYLLERHPDQCGAVLSRLRSPGYARALTHPEVCVLVIERLILEPDSDGVAEAILREVAARFDQISERVVHMASLYDVLPGGKRIPWRIPGEPVPRFLQHRQVRLILAAERVVEDIARRRARRYWRREFPGDLIREVARALARRRSVQLDALLDAPDPRSTPMLASVKLAADRTWRPADHNLSDLRRARLRGAIWPGVQLTGAALAIVDLREADLRGAQLDHCRAWHAQLAGADLSGADLTGAVLSRANLTAADLSSVRAAGVDLCDADLQGARLDAADLEHADLHRARLAGSSMVGARLHGARLTAAELDRVDLRDADLEQANLDGLDLRLTELGGARFKTASMSGCNLEGVELETADFSGAGLDRAMLTGSRMPAADFSGADLRCAGLAEVSWPGANLSDANLWGAMFHTGSTRSGLVDSSVASEGTRTGFYTDEFCEQEYRTPEDIRKADLRGTDLRGASIGNVDFYLVDLRGARYDATQAVHLRRTGAIL